MSASTEVVGSVYSFLVKHNMKKAAEALLKDAKVDKKAMPTNGDAVDIAAAVELFKTTNKRPLDAGKASTTKKAKADSSSDSSSSSSSDSSDSEDEAPAKKAAPVTKAASAKKADSSSDSSSSDSSDSEDEAPAKKAAPAAKAAPAKKADSSSDSSSSDSSDSEDEKPAAKPVTAKKPAVSSDSSSSSSDSSDSEDEKPAAKKAVATPAKATPAKKAKADSSSDSSSSSSSDSSDSEDEAPPAKKAKSAAATPAPVTPSSSGSGDHKAYVKGLPWLASEDEVRDFFKACGDINSCELPMGDDGRSTGTAFVRFSARSGLDAALAMDGATWPGTERWLKIVEGNDTPRRGSHAPVGERPEGCDTVFVGNLPWDVDEDAMRALFGQAGEISSVRFSTDRETGEFRGFGHVSFYTATDAENAIGLAGSDLNGRPVRVDYAAPRNPAGGAGRGAPSPGRGGRGAGGRGAGGRGAGGRGGRGGGVINKNKGTIVAAAGTKMTFDE